MPKIDSNHCRAAAEEIARDAGAWLINDFRTPVKAVLEERPHDLKLEADHAANRLIENALRKQFPSHEVGGEECAPAPDQGHVRWIVDPIDGTLNYSQGIAHFSVSIALAQGKQTLVSIVYDPVADEMFSWDTSLERPQLNDCPISPSRRTAECESVMSFGMARRDGSAEIAEEILRVVPRFRKARVLGSAALALSYVACGRLDAYVEETLNEWDIAAGVALVKKAGGEVILSDLGDGKFSIVAHNGLLPLGAYQDI